MMAGIKNNEIIYRWLPQWTKLTQTT
jgi:hypothetical protein